MPRVINLVGLAAGLLVLGGCADAPNGPASVPQLKALPSAHRTDYPVDANGSPDQSVPAAIHTATVILGLPNVASQGGTQPTFEANMSMTGQFNRANISGKFRITKSGTTLFDNPNYSSGDGAATWTLNQFETDFNRHEYWAWPGACGATATGSTLNRAWWFAQIPGLPSVTWGEDSESSLASPVNSPACVAPTVSITPAGSIEVGEGAVQQFAAASLTPGYGEITAYEWKVDGAVVGSQPTFATSFAPGTHYVTLKVTNSADLSTTSAATTVTVEIHREEVYCNGVLAEAGYCGDGEGGGGGGGEGGGGDGTCWVVWVKVWASEDGGETWWLKSYTEYYLC